MSFDLILVGAPDNVGPVFDSLNSFYNLAIQDIEIVFVKELSAFPRGEARLPLETGWSTSLDGPWRSMDDTA
jgi:hypothetical protein